MEDDAEFISESFADYLLRRTKEFNTLTQTSPNDIEMWCKFVDFQDECSLDQRKSTGPVLEKKIAILERALEFNSNSEILLLKYLNLCGQLWNPNRVLEVWSLIIARHPDSPKLWKEYIRFRQCQFSSFSVSDSRSIYAQAIAQLARAKARLQSAWTGGFSEGPAALRRSVAAVEETMLSVFFRSCSFEKQSGYVERSIAMFQALIEYNCFCPKKFVRKNSRISFFEVFWESESARIGEPGSLTWRTWHKRAERGKVKDEMEKRDGGEEGETKDSALDTALDDWLSSEDTSCSSNWFPRRSVDVFDPDGIRQASSPGDTPECVRDTEAVVLFEDIRPFLFDVSDGSLRIELILQFLSHLGVSNELLGGERRFSSNEIFSSERCENWEMFETVEGLLGQDTEDIIYNEGELDGMANPLHMDSAQFAQEFLKDVLAAKKAAMEPTSEESTDTKQPVQGTTAFAQEFLKDVLAAKKAAMEPTSEESTDIKQPVQGTTATKQPVQGTTATKQPVQGTTAFENTATDPKDQKRKIQINISSKKNDSKFDRPSKRNDSSVLAPMVCNDSSVLAPMVCNDSSVLAPMVCNDSSVLAPMVCNTLKAVVKCFPESDVLKCCAIMCGSTYGGAETGRSIAMNLLKSDQTNLRLWDTYAKAELSGGNLKEARKVYGTALSMCSGLSDEQSRCAPLLFWHYASMEISQAKSFARASDTDVKQNILHILLSCSEKSFKKAKKKKLPKLITPIRIVKARKAFSSLLQSSDHSLWLYSEEGHTGAPSLPVSPGACFGVCAAWLELLVSGLEPAVRVFTELIFPNVKFMQGGRGGAQHEWVVTELVRMVHR
eukprot:268400_1